MRSLPISLCLVLVPLALAACESNSPVPQMGPHSARYITSGWRKSFRQELSQVEAVAQRDASATADARRRAAPEATAASARREALTAPEHVEEVELDTVEEPIEAAHETPAPKVARTLPPRPPVAAPVAAPPAKSAAGLPEPLRWAKRDYEGLGSRSPPQRVLQRRFVRLRLTELDGTPVRAREARPVLRSIVGVQDAVLNETTGTAVIVVDPNVEASTIVDRLKGQYRATVVR